MAITLQVMDIDLQKRHRNIVNDLWTSETAVIYTKSAWYAITTPTQIFFNAADIVGATIDATADMAAWIGEQLLIIGQTDGYEITAATYTAEGETTEAFITLTLSGPDADNLLYSADTTDIKCQLFGYTDTLILSFHKLHDDLSDRGLNIDYLSATRNFEDAQIAKAFSLIFRDFYENEQDKYYILMRQYEDDYLRELTNTSIDDNENDTVIGSPLGIKIQM